MIESRSAFYELVHLPTGKTYGGYSSNVSSRINWHRLTLNSGTHSSKKFQAIFTEWSDCEVRIYYTKWVADAMALEAEYLRCNLGEPNNCNAQTSYTTPASWNKLLGMTPAIFRNWVPDNRYSPKAMQAYERIQFRDHIRISIDGVEYNSIAAASRALDIQHGTITRRLVSKNFTNYKRLV